MQQINKMIDHTLLKPEASTEQIIKLCEEAKKYDFASVCINPGQVKLAKEQLQGSTVMVCTVIGFPLGANTSSVKAFETTEAIKDGADEIDMVINIGALKEGLDELVFNDILAVTKAAEGKTVKVIFETCLLTKEEIVKACQLSEKAGAHFVKTSTGFSTGGATVEDVKLMKESVSRHIEVKASGGVRSLNDAQQMISVGATRLGTSSGVAIMNGLVSNSSY
ncbi:deoxyribose-phosphate aldolase [Bacteriovorax sp. BSW11_IV]|uniref:deoxyribose-phosphate aldolase n=1 Tax=Bacteriovorax sp. BSW11_IV TaxID=1353529 RepID=UPI00038A0AA4|nr:deoxyribose-phosphate aldolase [Bacteriovorax sp. BSW11_IV]EQC43059.1 deoxyribose-phosphate aldolase [Bacteriovorax sp. BSW11_IV]